MSAARHRDGAIGAVLVSVVAIGRTLAAQRGAPFEGKHVTATQLDALFLITHSDDPLTPGALAARLGVTRGAVTQLVDGLRDLDLVEQVAHPTDARSRLLRLTAEAAAAVRGFEADLTARMRPVFDVLGDDELDDLAALLTRLGAPA